MRRHRSSARSRAIAVLALLAAFVVGWTTSAQAQTQCSGSIILGPDKGQNSPTDVLESGETLTVTVGIFNTSLVGGVPAAAAVRGTTTIVLACATEFPCVSELASLAFDSCTPEADVTSCAVDPANSNHVLITYTPVTGKALGAAGTTTLATLNLHAVPGEHVLVPATGDFFIVGDTGGGNIFNASCAGSGQGSAPLFYPGICGDGIADIELGEECDDGNTVPFDGCGIEGGGANNCLICPDSTPCPDTDENECTDAGCNASGVCDQNHTLPNSEPCTDTTNECAAAGCNGAGQCDQNHTPVQDSQPCTDNDGNDCTEAGCQAGQCDQNHVLPDSKPCTDTGNECADAGCDGAGSCDQLHVPAQDSTPCADTDDNTCTEAGCEAGLCVQTHVLPDSKPCTDTGNECSAAGCNGSGGCDQNHTPAQDSTPCTDNDDNTCTESGCEAGQCVQSHVTPDSKPCEDTDGIECTTAGCDGAGSCDQTHVDTCVEAIGCRITGGRFILDEGPDPFDVTEEGDLVITRGQGGGQVGAPCGCIGCFDEFDHVQGNWQYSRKKKRGSFHAKDFNSLVCGCTDCDGNVVPLTGELCNPGGESCGPEPRKAPANIACFSGVGAFSETGTGKKTIQVAFRVEVEDRGEPAVEGSDDGTTDVHRIRIWIPTGDETAKELADGACCTNADPEGAIGAPDIDDGGELVHGNLQIHPMLHHSEQGVCPVPDGNCQE